MAKQINHLPDLVRVQIPSGYCFFSNFPKLKGQILAFSENCETKYPFHIDLDTPNKRFAQVLTMQSHAITQSLFSTKNIILGHFQCECKFKVLWDVHNRKRYPCTQKIRSPGQKLTILGLNNFIGKMLILGTGFQSLCPVGYWAHSPPPPRFRLTKQPKLIRVEQHSVRQALTPFFSKLGFNAFMGQFRSRLVNKMSS